MIPNGRLYADEHTWLTVSAKLATLGITDYAQERIGAIEFVDFPPVGRPLTKGDEVCAIESSKAAVGIATPVSGKLVAVNESLREDPSPINSDPYEQGWLCRLELADKSELATLVQASEYALLIGRSPDER